MIAFGFFKDRQRQRETTEFYSCEFQYGWRGRRGLPIKKWVSRSSNMLNANRDRKGVHILIFIKNENVNAFPKIWTARFAFWKKWKCEHVFLYDLFRFAIWNKMKIRTPFRNLNGQKLLGVFTSGIYINARSSVFIPASQCKP